MEQIINPPFCYVCNGLGSVFSNVEDISHKSFIPRERECRLCSGTGIGKPYNQMEYNGEIVWIEGRIGIFISQIHRNYAQILVGSTMRTVPNENIHFLNLKMITPTRGDLFL